MTIKQDDLQNDIQLNIDSKIGEGETRVVYKIKGENIVIKKAINQKGKEDNKNEQITWNCVKNSEYEDYFCPVNNNYTNMYSNKYLFMEYAKTGFPSPEQFNELREVMLNINCGLLDMATENVGTHNGKLKMIDYPYGEISFNKNE